MRFRRLVGSGTSVIVRHAPVANTTPPVHIWI